MQSFERADNIVTPYKLNENINMKVILLKNIPKVGNKYDIKDVSDGHALNFMIPNGMVEIATPQAKKRAEKNRLTMEQEKQIQNDLLAKNLGDLANIKIEIKEKANDKGHLFKGVHKEELVLEIKKQTELDITPDFIMLEKPIKTIGEHEVEVRMGEKSVKFNVSILAL